jgi:hypothetical protein
VKGREAPSDITLFKSLGIGVEDVASARFVYDRAVKAKKGKSVEFGGERFDAVTSPRRRPVKKPSKARRRR